MPRHLTRHPLLLALALGSALAGGWLGWQWLRGPRVPLVKPQRAPLVQTVIASGRVRPQLLQLSPLVTARVSAVAVSEGQQVDAGALLLQLEDQEARARLAEAEAALARARVQRRGVGSLQLGQAQAQLDQAQARAEEAADDLRRVERLASRGAVSAAALERARTTARVADSALRDARLELASLGRGGVRARDAQAAVRLAEASLALAQAHLDYSSMAAPVAGTILSLDARVGDVVQVGEHVIELAARGRTELAAELDERNLALLRLGQAALASAEAYPERRFAARVSFIAPAVDAAQGTVEVRLVVEEPPDYLRPDMTVSIDIQVARKDSALTLPASAVFDLATRPYVLVPRGGVARRQPVRVGLRDEQRVELLGGITEDAEVIAAPGVQPGQRVRAEVAGR